MKIVTNQNLMEELQVSKKEQKLRAQVKSRWYYTFWGTATIAVVAGQIYVGSGYRLMAKSFNRIMNTIVIELEEDFRRYDPPEHPMVIQ